MVGGEEQIDTGAKSIATAVRCEDLENDDFKILFRLHLLRSSSQYSLTFLFGFRNGCSSV